MKKLLFGMMLFCSGSLSAAMLLAGSMANDWTLNGQPSALWNIFRYGLLPALYIFLGLAVLGLVIAVCGLFDPEKCTDTITCCAFETPRAQNHWTASGTHGLHRWFTGSGLSRLGIACRTSHFWAYTLGTIGFCVIAAGCFWKNS